MGWVLGVRRGDNLQRTRKSQGQIEEKQAEHHHHHPLGPGYPPKVCTRACLSPARCSYRETTSMIRASFFACFFKMCRDVYPFNFGVPRQNLRDTLSPTPTLLKPFILYTHFPFHPFPRPLRYMAHTKISVSPCSILSYFTAAALRLEEALKMDSCVRGRQGGRIFEKEDLC